MSRSRAAATATTAAAATTAATTTAAAKPTTTNQPARVVDGDRIISGGEYCTLARAYALGIYNNQQFASSRNIAPFSPEYADLKTYNEDIDTKDGREKSLCKMVIRGSDPATASNEAYPHCIDVKGPGFVKRAVSSDESPYECRVYDCPPGFTPTGDFCSKEPMYKDALIDKRSRCDERWYDWFTLPNYHIGNKYHEESVGKCYTPCPNNYVPLFAYDPVDGTRMGLFTENKLTQCVPKSEFFGGKYAGGADYCPLAWIFRLYTCNKDHAKELIQENQEALKVKYGSNMTTIFQNAASSANQDAEALHISLQSQKLLENVPFPKDATLQACNTLNTKERLDKAYMICESLKKEGNLNLTGGDDAGSIINGQRNEVLRQACNAVFCNDQVGTLDVISKDPICFESTKQIDPKAAATMSEEKPSQPDYSDNENFLYRSIKVTILIVAFMVGGMVFYIIFSRFIWPYSRWFFYKVLGLFTGRKYAYVEYKAKAMDEIARARSRAAAAMVNT